MIKNLAMSMLFAVSLAPTVHAATLPLPGIGDGAIVKIGEGCGAGRWRGPYGGCNYFNGPAGNNRGTTVECPPAFHFVPGSGRCWPNR